MRSTKISFRVPNPLLEMFVEDCDDKDLRNIGRWFQSLGIDRVMQRRRTALYDFIAKAPPRVQDALIDVIRAFPEDPEQMQALLTDATRRATVAQKQRRVVLALQQSQM